MMEPAKELLIVLLSGVVSLLACAVIASPFVFLAMVFD